MIKWNNGIYFYLWILILNYSFNLGNGYRNIRLQDYLCADKFILKLQKPFRGDPTFTLTEDRDSAAIITQVWNATLPGVYSSNKLKYDCSFRVQTLDNPPRGIYTVITRLKFRRNPTTNECLDYIQFSSGNKSPSSHICSDIGPASRVAFDQRDRDVNVKIHIDKRHMIYEPLELTMVLTAHSECRYSGDFLCDPNEKYSCISRHFVRDNITNCLGPCRDEVTCFNNAYTVQEVDTTSVAISAITSLIFTMLGVGFCVWICWKYWNCITVQQRAHEASAAASATATAYNRGMRHDVPVIELPSSPSYDDIITAGLDNQQQHVPQPQTPKDLPPSYESLFPDR